MFAFMEAEFSPFFHAFLYLNILCSFGTGEYLFKIFSPYFKVHSIYGLDEGHHEKKSLPQLKVDGVTNKITGSFLKSRVLTFLEVIFSLNPQ